MVCVGLGMVSFAMLDLVMTYRICEVLVGKLFHACMYRDKIGIVSAIRFLYISGLTLSNAFYSTILFDWMLHFEVILYCFNVVAKCSG